MVTRQESSEARVLRGHYGYCEWCKKPNNEGYPRHRFCSYKCRGEQEKALSPEANRICINCKVKFRINPAYLKRRMNAGIYCSRVCYAEYKKNHIKVYLGKDGYMHKGHTREHRTIMEKHLGRELESTEHVHHGDGNKSNNCVDNLEVMTHSEHSRRHVKRTKIPEGDYEEFKLMYLDRTKSVKYIKKYYGVSYPAIRTILGKLHIPFRHPIAGKYYAEVFERCRPNYRGH